MEVFKTIQSIRSAISSARSTKSKPATLGFVPTMGALHLGHLSLIEQSCKENCLTVVSIFVNPTQFESKDDFDKYPDILEQDLKMLENAGVDIVFAPSILEMYPDLGNGEGNHENVFVDDISNSSQALCGNSRTNHFRGVLTVVAKLFNIIKPENAYFGKKDYQQLFLVKKMTNFLNFDTNIIGVPTKREESGLAMSSRNARLSQQGLLRACAIYRALTTIKQRIQEATKKIKTDIVITSSDDQQSIKLVLLQTHIALIMNETTKDFKKNDSLAKIEYLSILDADTLLPIAKKTTTAIVAIAVVIENVRLIDNVLVSLV